MMGSIRRGKPARGPLHPGKRVFRHPRGGAESEADTIHYPGTYLAGGYNRLKTEIAGRVIENEDLVNMPNWLLTRFRPEGATGSISSPSISFPTARN
jgi:hypothetical protein